MQVASFRKWKQTYKTRQTFATRGSGSIYTLQFLNQQISDVNNNGFSIQPKWEYKFNSSNKVFDSLHKWQALTVFVGIQSIRATNIREEKNNTVDCFSDSWCVCVCMCWVLVFGLVITNSIVEAAITIVFPSKCTHTWSDPRPNLWRLILRFANRNWHAAFFACHYWY